MKKNEALKAAIDGKKVSHKSWDSNFYITWDGSLFRTEVGEIYYFKHACDSEWQIVPEYVDFAEAWNAYEKGKKILPQRWVKDRKDSDYYQKSLTLTELDRVFTDRDIRGKWLILEDE